MKISLLEDEKVLARAIYRKLFSVWYDTSIFNSISDFKENFSTSFGLYLIDISLSDWNWYDVIDWLKNKKKLMTPIIVISWFKSYEYKVKALNMWADDYICKPIIPDELIARIWSLIRRVYSDNRTLNSFVSYKDIEFDVTNKVIKKSWRVLRMSKKELQLCELFLFNIWKLLTKDYVIDSVWAGFDTIDVSDNTLNVTICRIRKKLWKKFKLSTKKWIWYILYKA